MKIIKVEYCFQCHFNKEINGLHCCKKSDRVFKFEEFPMLLDSFPKWCGLPDKK